MRQTFKVCIFLLFCKGLLGQVTDTSQLFKANVKEMIDLKGAEEQEQTSNIGSFKDAKIREIPGIITVLDNAFIQNSGARDLVDLLHLVPGFDFARDVDDVVGIAVRGNTALEGKVLVMLNGIQLNETGYGTFAFKGHFVLDNIEKIEIVRGPGSTLYGGVASLAVINIVTKTSKYNDGVEFSTSIGVSESNPSAKRGAINFAHKFNNGATYNFSGYINHSNISNITQPDAQEKLLNYRDSSGLSNEGFVSSFHHKNFNYNFVYDNYQLDITDNPSRIIMKNIINQVSYTIKPIKQLAIRPEITYKWSLPWNYQDGNRAQNDALTAINNRTDFKLVTLFTPNENILFSAGGQYYIDDSRYQSRVVTFYDSSNNARFNTIAAFTEVQLFTKYFNLTAGARYEKLNSSLKLTEAPEAFVPRFAITKAFSNFHVKTLYSRAYKIPTIQNINASFGTIKPENLQVIEFEAGVRLNKAFTFNINVFDNQLTNPIVFGYNNLTATEEYLNKTLIYNRGAEAEISFRNKRITAQANFSTYYNTKNEVTETFIDTVQTKELAGLARFKGSFYLSLALPKNWFINTNLICNSERSSYVYTDSLFTKLELKTISPRAILNFSVSKSNFFIPQLKFDLMINNLLNQEYYYANALDNGFNLLPDQRFELSVRLTYKIGM